MSFQKKPVASTAHGRLGVWTGSTHLNSSSPTGGTWSWKNRNKSRQFSVRRELEFCFLKKIEFFGKFECKGKSWNVKGSNWESELVGSRHCSSARRSFSRSHKSSWRRHKSQRNEKTKSKCHYVTDNHQKFFRSKLSPRSDVAPTIFEF